jgi:zinc transport system substrate-binding protein
MLQRLLLTVLCAVSLSVAAAPAPNVVVSIAPVHSLVAGVIEGVGSARLIVTGGGSPHAFSMRPSDARALQDADVIFWFEESLETFLQRPLRALGSRARVVALIETEGLTLHPNRVGGIWEAEGLGHGDAHAHDHDHHHGHDHGDVDAHIWLDPENARHMVRRIAAVLSEVDPDNAAHFQENARRLDGRLVALDEALRARLEPVRGEPFLVFHDGYQYLERRYGLSAAGSVTVSPEQAPGARRLSEIRARLGQVGARCVFREPQFPSPLVDTLVEGTGVRVGTLDPLGAELPPGQELYFDLMRAAADGLLECLSP